MGHVQVSTSRPRHTNGLKMARGLMVVVLGICLALLYPDSIHARDRQKHSRQATKKPGNATTKPEEPTKKPGNVTKKPEGSTKKPGNATKVTTMKGNSTGTTKMPTTKAGGDNEKTTSGSQIHDNSRAIYGGMLILKLIIINMF